MYNWHINKTGGEVFVTRVDRKTGEGFLAIRGNGEDVVLSAILLNCRVGDLVFFSNGKAALFGRYGAKT